MIGTTFAALGGSVAAGPEQRATGEVKPNWDLNTVWINRFDLTDFDTYVLFTVGYTDPSYSTDPNWHIDAEMRMTPTGGASQSKSTLTAINAGEGKMTNNGQGWENGTWETIVTNPNGDPNVQTGQSLDQGAYKFTSTNNGETYVDMSNTNFKRGTSTNTMKWDATGDITYAFDVTDVITQSTSNGIDAEMKPDWATKPMNVGDSWKQTDKLTSQINEDYAWTGDFSGGDTVSVTRNFMYDFTWTVATKAQKVIPNTMKGTTTFQDGYKITRSGKFDWDATDGTNSNSGTVTPGPYEQWYAGDGDNFDAGNIIDYNGTTRLIWSSYIAFINTAPKFDSAPPADVTINSDEAWVFKEGVDYAVSDIDPSTLSNGAGTLTYAIKKVLPDHTNILKDLAIDSETGEITLTPTQKDVADGYQITINVTDNYDKGKLGAEATFTLNIKNKNHAPTLVSPPVMADFTMKEGETNTPTWKLSDAFKDSDMDLNPLMNNAPYDASEKLIFSVTNNGSVRVVCSNGNDLTTANQCADARFNAIDGKFPRDQPVAMTFTATDKAGQKITDQVTVTVQHVNHGPKAIKESTTYKMDEDTQGSIDMKTLFKDIDVWDPNYVTVDQLGFDKDGEKHLTITITGTKATIKSDKDWNGEEEITFTATDKSSAKAEVKDNIIVAPINDQPTVTSVNPTADPTIFETKNGQESDVAGSQKFSVVATDVDNTVGVSQNDVLTYNWTVEDEAQNVYKADTHSADWTFTAAFDCDFDAGAFCGGDSTKTYYVTAKISDGKSADVEAKKWYMTVKNVNRKPELSGVEVFTVTSAGVKTPLIEKTPLNYTVAYGKVIELDVTNKVTDKDLGIADGTGIENLDKLSFEWTSSISGSFGIAADVKVGAGSAKAPATMALKAGGTHIITVRVTDSDQGSDSYAITIKVAKKPNPGVPGFEAILMVSAMVVAVVAVSYKLRK